MNFGNFVIILNDFIKNEFFIVDKFYKKLKYFEDYFRYDVEIIFYEFLYVMIDIYLLFNNYFY